MKQITINGFQTAIFKVDNSHHITVHPANYKETITENEFNECTEAKLYITNEFSETFKRLPEEWTERVIKKPYRNKQQLLIIIIK